MVEAEPTPAERALLKQVQLYWEAHPKIEHEGQAWFDAEYSLEAVQLRRQGGEPLPPLPVGWEYCQTPPENEPFVRLSRVVQEMLQDETPWSRPADERAERARRILWVARLIIDPDFRWEGRGLGEGRGETAGIPRAWVWRWLVNDSPEARARWNTVLRGALEELGQEVEQDGAQLTLSPEERARRDLDAKVAAAIIDGDPKPITEQERAVLELLVQLPPNKGLTGPQICDALSGRGWGLDESSLRKRIIPALKDRCGLQRAPRRGYFLPPDQPRE